MNLKHLTDKTLLVDTKNLVLKERENLTKILHHLKEIDRRKLYCDLKCSSLFDYCIRELGYSEGSAQRRIQACRLLADIPEIEEKIEEGLLNLSNIAQAASFFNQQDIKDKNEKKDVLAQLENMTQKEGEKKLFEISGDEIKAKEGNKRISKDKVKVTLVLENETVGKFDRLNGLIGKNLSKSDLVDKALDISIQHVELKKFKVSPPQRR